MSLPYRNMRDGKMYYVGSGLYCLSRSFPILVLLKFIGWLQTKQNLKMQHWGLANGVKKNHHNDPAQTILD